ncbi:MAG: mycofactocin biosynthesis peptidyl-dipeptidase MftE [Mycobacteriaceae bacterium]
MHTLSSLSWPQVPPTALLVVPLGAVEQHGPHLPLDTDTRIATAAANALVTAAPAALLGPAQSYGASGEHQGFAGTVSLGVEALTLLLVELGRSACEWATRLLIVNGHGGNAFAVREAVLRLRGEDRDVAWLPCSFPDADAHAGRTETSLLLHLAPAVVHLDRAAAGTTAPIGEILGALRSRGTAAVSANGVLGDPTGASAEEGAELMGGWTAKAVAALGRWAPDAQGCLR